MIEKLKKRWNITSNTQFWLIMLTFAITGSLSAKLAKPICEYFGIFPDTYHPVLYWLIRLLIILPAYQVILLIVGTIFGQFKFFWEFEKKMIGIRPKKKTDEKH